MTSGLALAYPVLAEVLWTLLVLSLLGYRRYGAVRARRAKLPGLDLSKDGWPDDVRKVSNNFDNQFQTPVLFYVLCGVAAFAGTAGHLMVALAWFYVLTRVLHTAVHVTTNYVPYRFAIFFAGVVALMIMLAIILVRLLG